MNIAVPLIIMATRSASSLSSLPAASQCRVAVCGAGVAGALTARRLAEAGMAVTCFEAGRGPGGRTSSRRTDLGHFDHGASYFAPKTEAFAKTVDEWVSAGAAAEWRGRFGTLRDGAFRLDEDAPPRYVGTPRMSAIPRHLLAHERITCVYGTRVKGASFDDGWTLRDARGADLGRFDALVSSDRLMASVAGLTAPPAVDTVLPELNDLPVFADAAGKVESSRALVLMLGFAEEFGQVPFDAALVEGDDVVSYVSRDSSKPGRAGELWTVHATPANAERTLTAAAAEAAASGEDPRAALQSKTPELVAAVGRLLAPWVPELPPPDIAVAHRWGAAFPSKPEGGTPPAISELGGRFVAVGDYLVGPRVEGAVASAEAGARLLIDACA
jgi:renalase